MKTTTTAVYFPGLNGLRFFAAFAVVLTHIEFTKKLLGHGERLWVNLEALNTTTAIQACWNGQLSWWAPLLTMFGEFGVVFFFVLSGFLITFLLLKEREVKGDIAVGKFYLRRLLRIWPLYLLIVLLGFFVLPYLTPFHIYQQQRYMWYGFDNQLILYLLMMPNVAFAFYNIAIPNIGQAWSIGVEEQFYLIWPWLVKKFQNTGRMVMGFLLVLMGLKVLVILCPEQLFEGIAVWKRLLGMTKMECMALGAYGAYLVYYKKTNVLGWMYRPWMLWASLMGIFVVLYTLPVRLIPLIHIFLSLAFLIVILNVAANTSSRLQLRSRWLDYLGKISYGIYMYHMIVITLVIYLVKGRIIGFEKLSGGQNLLVYGLSILGTILVASLSYRFFETPWMRLKERFTTIRSGDAAKELH